MLDDAHKPLRPSLRSRMIIQNPIDIRPRNMQLEDRGTRLANARDKTSIYALSQDKSMTDSERETIRNRLRERFQPSSRSVPASVQGLQNLASRRIEDAIARGQFKNIPRGKGVLIERDHNADSPFIDTTEYFMNKIIKKQDLTPPWIEKQAEIHRTATMFRGRLRADWKRHAARVIASKGGSFDGQIARARAYAKAETIYNPTTKPTEDLTKSLQEISKEDSDIEALPSTTDTALTNESTLPPFRDSAWSSLELSYHTMAIKELNNLTRSYNLMAPELAKKPYFNLERELKACYAEVAPQLADEIRNRALAPKAKIEIIGHAPGGLLEKFAIGETAKVADDRRKAYGFREFWRDLFAWKE